MSHKIKLLAAALLCSTFAMSQNNSQGQGSQRQGNQRRGNWGYQVTFVNNSKTKADTAELRKVFNAVYPSFARADGYRTKREVTFEISDNFDGPISAKAGEIIVNSKWLSKNQKNLEKALMAQFAKNWVSADTIVKNNYQLVFISKDPNLDLKVKQNLIDTYFKVYPTIVDIFNKNSTKSVLFVVDTAYKAVAEASGNRILFSAQYMKNHPTDIDVVTHETMHIAQGYGGGAGPGWLTEGIADYVRYKYGVDNIGSKWALPEFNEKQSYKNAYRVTARFFEWIEQNVKSGVIAQLDDQLRKRVYTEDSWKALTGKTLDEHWADYAKNPSVKLVYSGQKS
jgi:cytochrome oxidase Cu insertion factor (SCO1/SenC/PrrC family)